MLSIILAIENEEDRSFVEWIYNTYEKKMYKQAFVILKHHDDAQDCVHDTIHRIIEVLPTFKAAHDKGSLSGLLSVTCYNCARNFHKQRARRNRHIYEPSGTEDEPYLDVENLPDKESDLNKIMLSEENCRFIQTLIESMDDIYRDVLYLKSKDFNYAQIAILLGITEETARQRTLRARRLLEQKGGKRLYEMQSL